METSFQPGEFEGGPWLLSGMIHAEHLARRLQVDRSQYLFSSTFIEEIIRPGTICRRLEGNDLMNSGIHPLVTTGNVLVYSFLNVDIIDGRNKETQSSVNVVEKSDNLQSIHGRYTRNIDDYNLVIPHKLTPEGNFLSFSLPNYFAHQDGNKRKKRSLEEDDSVNYGIWVDGKYYQLELYPNYDLLSPSAVIEKRDPTVSVGKQDIRSLTGKKICHYRGTIKGKPNSRVAISTCDGLAGYIIVDNQKFFVEPVMEHGANKKGHHLHTIYRKTVPHSHRSCGTTCDWESEWKKRLKESFLKHGEPKPKRTLESKHRYLEVLAVCDKKFLRFHKAIDVQTYVMTVMNMVYDYYQDASSGNQLDIAVVRIIYLEKEEEEIDLSLSKEGHKTLRSFCDWQATVNPKDKNNPIHHDIAVLLTRHDLCDEKIHNCDLMGLAYVGVPCTEKEPCAINEDKGLVLAIVVTHEIGHVMGCAHDSPSESGCPETAKDGSFNIMAPAVHMDDSPSESGCPETAKDGSFNIMAPAVHMDTRQWSTCSKTFITTLLDNELGECLNDEPDESSYKFAHLLPGVVYDHTYQCNWFMKGSELCGPISDRMCELLMCTMDRKKCSGCGEPAADGTKCGEDKWCYRGKCVKVGRRPEAINGGWGNWGTWSECSRTCGIGLSFQERQCDNPPPEHGGRYCLGERKKAKLCNTDPCPETARSFRAVQCTEKDKEPSPEGQMHTWKPYFLEDKACELYCINEENVFAKLAPRVKDGTKCKRGAKDVCISGMCTKIGCDMKINSDAVEDICGVCEGDGTTCKVLEDTFHHRGQDYTKVVVVPKGAMNLEFEELGGSINTIAVADESGHYFINGDHKENTDNSYDCGGAEGVYSHLEPTREKFVLYGPLKRNLVLYVCFYNPTENVGYRYKYADPGQPNPDYKPSYHWEIVKWADCTARCGGGSEIGEPSCIEEKMGKVSPKLCQGIEKPPTQTRVCNELPCPIKWRVGKWGKCVACKNKSGVRVREVECVRESAVPNGEDVLLEDDLCPSPKPPSRELCDSGKVCVGVKRSDLGVPLEMMRELWYQTIVDMININPAVREDVVMNARTVRKINRDFFF
ncbi:ADAM-TS Spacer 1 [Popillia japonica]|uniref:ADAM-TS Spacer 1 n=1 Tax=Popillia japonica TaxID=7064 RepID=A0AAW1NAQ0_POPJA